MSYIDQNVLHIATEIGPRSKNDPNCVVMGEDSKYPDAVCMQHATKYDGQISWAQPAQDGKYRLYPIDGISIKKLHSFAYAIRAGMFTEQEVLVMVAALQELARKEQAARSAELFSSNAVTQ